MDSTVIKTIQSSTLRTKPTERRRKSSHGTAVVELAICLPILLLILFATIEACVMLQLKQNLSVTAYEGARIGIVPGSTSALIQTQCEMLLDDRNIQSYLVTVDPEPSTLSVGDMLTVTVSADCLANAVAGGVFFEGKSISETVVMRAE